MPILPLSNWTQTYKDIFYGKFDATERPMLWAKWVHKNSKGMQSTPYTTSVNILEQAFPPVSLPAGTAAQAAQFISQAWFSYVCSAVWTPAPPIPPFSAVTSVVMNVAILTAAQDTLMSALLTEMMNLTSGSAALETKALNIATAFYTASLSMGVLVTGLSLPTPTPIALIVPSVIF